MQYLIAKFKKKTENDTFHTLPAVRQVAIKQLATLYHQCLLGTLLEVSIIR